jgi:hypothetical protein
MKQQTKAALLSGLAFPGLGQLILLKRPIRGLVFTIPALASFAWLMHALWQATTILLNEALQGKLPPDAIIIATRLSEASALPGTGTAGWILLACWLASILDALAIKDKP